MAGDFFMRSTPPVPDWLQSFRHPCYTNIYEMYPAEDRVFGTESLFGDWDAEVLLFAKDFAPRSVIEARRAGGDPRPFRHGDREQERRFTPPDRKVNTMGCRTNEHLKNLVAVLGTMPLLYGSALGGLMRNDGKTSGRLPDEKRVLREYAVPLLRWCVTQLPKLRAIACLGNHAFDVVCMFAVKPAPAPRHGEPCPLTIEGRQLDVFRLYHPAAPYKAGALFHREWQDMAQVLGVTPAI